MSTNTMLRSKPALSAQCPRVPPHLTVPQLHNTLRPPPTPRLLSLSPKFLVRCPSARFRTTHILLLFALWLHPEQSYLASYPCDRALLACVTSGLSFSTGLPARAASHLLLSRSHADSTTGSQRKATSRWWMHSCRTCSLLILSGPNARKSYV